MDSLLSIRTLRKSIKTLQDNLKAKDELLDYSIGWETYKKQYENIKKDGDFYIKKSISEELKRLSSQKQHFNSEEFKNPDSINTELEALKEIIELCKEQNVELHIFISPTFSQLTDLIYNKGYQLSYHYFKTELSKYGSVYDFSGYNSITTDISNYIDGSHYQTKLAEFMFAKIFNDNSVDVATDFGTILTPKNIDSILQEQSKRANKND
jgi:hypothetical protein